VFTQAAGNSTAFTINPATLSYIANAASRTYGAADPAFSGSVTGFVLGENLGAATGGTASFTTTAANTSNVGSYAINGSGLTANNGNYVFTQAAGNSTAFTINPATLTYIANAASRAYGASDPAFSGSVTGFVLGENLGAATTGTAAFTTNAVSTSNVGSYGITGSGLTANFGNYVFTQAAGNSTAFTINPATLSLLSVSANDANKTYGVTLTFNGTEFTPVGLLNGDTISGVTLTSPGAVNTANVGTYAITPSNAVFSVGSAANYNISYVNGQLTVTAAPLSITADALSKIYGNADPALTYVVSGLLFNDALTGSLSRPNGENVGAYAISQGTLSNPNYAITYTGNNLSITPRPINVAADAISRVYGDSDPTLTYTVGGSLAPWDTNATVFSGTLFRAPGEDVAAGPYAISQGTLAATSNYTITFAGNFFTITPALLSVYAIPTSKVFGTSDPLLTYLLSGLRLNDTEATVLNGGSLDRDPGEEMGSNYQINQGTLALNSSNYTLNYFPASFNILPPTVVGEITNAILQLGTPETGGAQGTGSSNDEDKPKPAEVVVTAGTTTGNGATTQPLPVCQ
jgi:hypothetical protein